MPRSLHRRSFINSILLLSVAPLATPKKLQLAKKPASYQHQILRNIKPLGHDFVSINGWVLPKETLIKGNS